MLQQIVALLQKTFYLHIWSSSTAILNATIFNWSIWILFFNTKCSKQDMKCFTLCFSQQNYFIFSSLVIMLLCTVVLWLCFELFALSRSSQQFWVRDQHCKRFQETNNGITLTTLWSEIPYKETLVFIRLKLWKSSGNTILNRFYNRYIALAPIPISLTSSSAFWNAKWQKFKVI